MRRRSRAQHSGDRVPSRPMIRVTPTSCCARETQCSGSTYGRDVFTGLLERVREVLRETEDQQ